MAKMNHEKLNRQMRGVQIEGRAKEKRAKITKRARGKFSKWNDQWAIMIVDGHSIPENKIVTVIKADGTSTQVQLLKIEGSKRWKQAKLNFYSFIPIDEKVSTLS